MRKARPDGPCCRRTNHSRRTSPHHRRTKTPSSSGPAGILPLRLGGQSVPPARWQSSLATLVPGQPLAELHRIVPTDEACRIVVPFENVFLFAREWCASCSPTPTALPRTSPARTPPSMSPQPALRSHDDPAQSAGSPSKTSPAEPTPAASGARCRRTAPGFRPGKTVVSFFSGGLVGETSNRPADRQTHGSKSQRWRIITSTRRHDDAVNRRVPRPRASPSSFPAIRRRSSLQFCQEFFARHRVAVPGQAVFQGRRDEGPVIRRQSQCLLQDRITIGHHTIPSIASDEVRHVPYGCRFMTF